jgi:heme/copper-type cytochrome/quinol oxidase subunit 4
MTAGADADSDVARPGMARLVTAFVALIALTCCELLVVGMAVGRAARITALAGLLMVKVGLVLSFFMRARASRRASWLVLVSIGAAAGFAVVLMLEMVFRVNVH